MTRILLTNDDGIAAEGLRALELALAPLGEIYTVAPSEERSAASHSISLRKGVHYAPAGERRWAVDGTPADSVITALHLLNFWPDLVVSGINHGGNLGKNVHYSGTVGAAVEAALNDIPAMAVSVCGRAPFDFGPATGLAAGLAARIIESKIPSGTLVNVNVPREGIKGVRLTRAYRNLARTNLVPLDGREGLWFQEVVDFDHVPPDSDYTAIRAGFASVSLLEIFREETGEISDVLGLGQ